MKMGTETRSDEEIDNTIERWHRGHGLDQSLHAFLGWTWEEYKHWVETGEKP